VDYRLGRLTYKQLQECIFPLPNDDVIDQREPFVPLMCERIVYIMTPADYQACVRPFRPDDFAKLKCQRTYSSIAANADNSRRPVDLPKTIQTVIKIKERHVYTALSEKEVDVSQSTRDRLVPNCQQ
jgi:hypothetical protein